jgi:flavin reductase (DIM6/NTAB) family NADH-FMN oxidoreductase RutF
MITAEQYRRTLGKLPTGVVVVTAMDGDTPTAMVIGSFTSVSLDPALVGFFAATTSSSWQRLRTADRFAVNVLAADQEDVCRRMASKVSDKFEGIEWTPDAHGCPLIAGTAATISCRVHSRAEAGDHEFVLGEVEDLSDNGPREPLIFHGGSYGSFVERT